MTSVELRPWTAADAHWYAESARDAEIQRWTHADNHASQRVAERAGFIRDEERGQVRDIAGTPWPTVAYRRRLP